MKLIVAGSRDWTDIDLILSVMDEVLFSENPTFFTEKSTEIVHGGCPTGVDAIVAECMECDSVTDIISCKVFNADWDAHGKAAGPIRNRQMAEYADACIVFQLGDSRGSASMIVEAKRAGIPLVVFWRAK